jgi:hypothetical protein
MAHDVEAGRPTGLSIGWEPGETATHRDGESRAVHSGTLHEVSLCLGAAPAQKMATLGRRRKSTAEMRAFLAEAEAWTERQKRTVLAQGLNLAKVWWLLLTLADARGQSGTRAGRT